ncbi:MAG: hypothetical protein K1X64_02015 [Myxococcaceae bacterium]|nr:hypothetical protein [Myxococcaceae bacterium]
MKAFALGLVLAYVLPSYSILKRTASGRDDLGLTTLKVEGAANLSPALGKEVAEALGVAYSGGEWVLDAQVTMKLPGRCRLQLSSPESTKSVAAVWSNGKKRVEGGSFPALMVAVEEICATLALRGAGEGESRVALEKHLAVLKVDTSKTWLGRFANTVAYGVGVKQPGAAQFWVYKDGFLPARVMFSDAQGTAWDVQFLDYSGQATSEWFPRVFEVHQGNEVPLKVTALKADAKPKLDDSAF